MSSSTKVDALINELKEINELMKSYKTGTPDEPEEPNCDIAPVKNAQELLAERTRRLQRDVKKWQECQTTLKEIEEILTTKKT